MTTPADRGAAPAGPEREAELPLNIRVAIRCILAEREAELPLNIRVAIRCVLADFSNGKIDSYEACHRIATAALGERPAEAPSEADVWNYCPVCGKALEHLTPENRGIRPLPGVGLLTRHANTTPMCPLPLRSGATAPAGEPQ